LLIVYFKNIEKKKKSLNPDFNVGKVACKHSDTFLTHS